MIRNHSRHGSRFPITLGGGGGYSVNKSLRFRSSASAYLNRTPATATNQTTWTWSAWVKRGALADGTLFSAGVSSQPYAILAFSSNQLVFDCINSGPVVVGRKYTNALYRDPAAWYHVVAVWNTTNGTAGNRMLLYVNGEQVTSFLLSTDPASSATTQVNSTVAHQLGQFLSAGSYFDGEMAEVNFVDGQALLPTAFGAYSTYNQWLPIRYAGTYGTNGFYLPFNSVSTSSYAGAFLGNTYSLTTTTSQIIPATGDFTIEAMINLSNLGTTPPICAQGTLGGSGRTVLFVSTTGAVSFSSNLSTVISAVGLIKTYNWYYIAVTRSGANTEIYINGVSVASSTVSLGTIQNTTLAIGTDWGGDYFNGGYVSNFRISTVVRTIAIPTAPFVNDANTKFLTLQSSTAVDNSSNSYAITNSGPVVLSVQYPFSTAVFSDSSGNGNNWTPNNISLTAGSTYDSLTDVPTLTSTTVANYAVINPIALNGGATLSSANLLATLGSTSADFVSSTIGCSGKNYIEFKGNSFGSGYLSFCVSNIAQTQGVFYRSDGTPIVNGSSTTGIASFTTSDIIAITVDTSTRAINLYKNNVQVGITYTASGTDSLFALISGSGLGSGSTSAYVNFGQQPFTYTAPTGFLPLNTFNIAAGTVTTSGTFTGNLSTDGPMVFLNGTPTAMTINGNAVTFGTQADKLANGFKVRSSSASYNASGSNTYVATTVGAVFKYEDAQGNP